MKRKLLLTFAMLLGVVQMSWSKDLLYFEDYDSGNNSVTLKYGTLPSLYDASYDSTVGHSTGTIWNIKTGSSFEETEVKTINVDASCQNFAGTCLDRLFHDFQSLTTINNIANLNTSTATYMGMMFGNCLRLKTLDLSSFNTANVEAMEYMFYNCSALESLNVSSFNTAKVTTMNSMFASCNHLQTLDISNFDTSNVEDMSFMFSQSTVLKTLNMTGFKTDKATTMRSMFENCNNLQAVDFSAANTPVLETTQNMFNHCWYIKTIDLSSFNTPQLLNMTSMFNNCRSLTSVNLSNFDTRKVTQMASLFNSCYALNTVDLSNFRTDQVQYMNGMFANCWNLTTLDLSSFDTSSVKSMNLMFSGCSSLKAIIVGLAWTTSAITESGDSSNPYNDMDMFRDCSNLVGEDGTKVTSSKWTGKDYGHTGAGGYLTKRYVNFNLSSTYVDGGYWATYYKSNVNRKADSNTTVYAATRSGSELTLVPVTDKIIKAGQGVILKRTGSNSIQLTSTTEAAGDAFYTNNALMGTDVAMAQLSEQDYYVLSNVDSKLGFYKYKADKTLGANKAYIALVKDSSAPEYLLWDNNTTSIAQPNAKKEMQPAEVFDLQGRRIAQPSIGLYIVNGKKVVIK